MLNSFRAFSNNFITRILLVLLIASFALWGIGDMLGRPSSNHTLAKIGSQSISAEDYRRELAIEGERIRRQLGANYSEELLRRLNVPQFVLRRMVQESLLQQEALRMGFIPDDTTVALEIRKNPAFLDHSSMFDKARFESALRNQGVSEKTYVERLRMQIATDKLLDALSIDLPIDDSLLSALQTAYNQGRNIALYQLSPDHFPTTATPTDAELETFQKMHAEQFTTPELRSVSFVRFSASDNKTAGNRITEETLRAYYKDHEEQFRTAEKREIEQLLYDSEDKAKTAYELVKQGKKFAEVAAIEAPLNRTSLSLGVIDKKGLAPNIADQVFSLKAGDVTKPLQSPFGWHIFRVISIESAGLQPLEKVRGNIEASLKKEAEESTLNDIINQMEDALAGGSSLADAAKSMGLSLEQAGTFDKRGNTPEGTANKALPDLDKFVDVAFKTEEKTESSTIASHGGIYYVLYVDKLLPEKLRSFSEAKNDISQAYRAYQANQAVADAASSIEEEMRKGKKTSEILAAHALSAVANGAVFRHSKTLGNVFLPPSFIEQIFASGSGALTAPVRDKDGGYLLAHITGIVAQPAGSEGTKLSKKDIAQQMQEEMMMQYLQHLETLYSVDIRQNMLDQLTQEPRDVPR